MAESSERQASWLARLVPWLVIGGLVLFHATNNWSWLSENVTSTGWDKPRHLARSLSYTDMLSPVTVQSLFGMMISDPVRPPLFPASAGIMYRLFGYTADVATMINVLYMAIALAATYGIGRRWGGRRPGLVAAILLALFPMFYSMSRYFYLEFALTAMVALTVYLLLATDSFQRRGMSLFFGLSLGLGLLTKRTFAIFAVGPVLAVVLTSGLLPALWQRLKQRPKLYWKNAIIALAGGLIPAAIWYLPNREAVQTLLLGDLLFLFWWALAALAIYFATLPSAPLSNSLAAFFLAAGLSSTWYLARIEFLQRVALYGYGIDDPRGRTLSLASIDTYLYYLRKLGNEHLSLVFMAVFAIVLLAAMTVYLRRHRSFRAALHHVRPEGWVVLAWAGGSYTLLTLSIYQETRAFTPALPAVALLFAAALFTLPWQKLRLALLILLLVFGLVQFYVISYEPAHRLLPPSAAELPLWGRTTTFAQGVYIQLPDEGRTDRGYWIQPDVLERMEVQREALDHERLSLGLLVNTSQINAGPFNYLILTEYPQLRVESLIARFDETSPYRSLFGHEYVAVKRINAGINPAQEQTINAILDGPPHLFEQVFELEATYPLPDDDTVFLYRRRYHLPADYPVEYVTRLATALDEQTQAGDAILLAPPELVGPFASHYTGPAEIYLVPVSEEELGEIATRHRRLFLIVGDPAAGQPDSLAQGWLNQNAFRASHRWSDSLQVLTFGTTAETPATSPATEVRASFGADSSTGTIELTGYHLPSGPWQPGDVVPLTLFWQNPAPVTEDFNVFVHLLDWSGQPVVQTDSAPVGGSRPTSSWGEGQVIVDRHGLLLPGDLPPGEYDLLVGLYLPATGYRLPVWDAAGNPLGDGLSLGQLEVVQE
jgi:4-amino-4-deoxy-L-arabinose transferase-like glycosyltransferase